jgi:hypothetical protein
VKCANAVKTIADEGKIYVADILYDPNAREVDPEGADQADFSSIPVGISVGYKYKGNTYVFDPNAIDQGDGTFELDISFMTP